MGSSVTDAAPVIDARGVVKRYDDKVVLDGFDLTVNRGETCVIIGGSGSGKTTFARLLVGLERPDAGEIWVDGVDIVRLDERELDRVRRVGIARAVVAKPEILVYDEPTKGLDAVNARVVARAA